MVQDEEHSVGTRTLRGMLWAYGSFAVGKFLVLVMTAILARLLTPEDFGLVALALTFIGLLEGLSNLGLGQALIIQTDEDLEKRTETAFVFSIVLGLGASAIIAALSPVISGFFGEPELTAIVAVLGLNLFVRSLGVTHYSLAQRQLNFRARTAAELSNAVARGVVGIGLALAGAGAWSLVFSYLAGTVVLNLVIWLMVDWRPKLKADLKDLGGMLRFGGTLSAVDVVASLASNIDNIFIGRVLGSSPLGIYTIAFQAPRLGVVNISEVSERVLFPAFAMQSGAEALGNAYRIATRYLWIFALPAATGLAILAEPVILGLFGDQWTEGIGPMRILTIYAFALATSFAAGSTYKALGRPGVILGLVSARLALLAVGLALFVDLGLEAAAACQAVGVVEVVGIVLASRLLGVPLLILAREVTPAILCTLLMAPPVAAIALLLPPTLPTMLAGAAVGAGVYAGALRLIAPASWRYLLEKLRPG